MPQRNNQVLEFLLTSISVMIAQDKEEHGAQAGEVQHVLQQVHQLAQL